MFKRNSSLVGVFRVLYMESLKEGSTQQWERDNITLNEGVFFTNGVIKYTLVNNIKHKITTTNSSNAFSIL